MKVLVTGWFSFEHGEATAGDLMAKDVACEWLEEAGRSYDVAFSPAFSEGVRWWEVEPANYTDLVFVCGPARGWQIENLIERFSNCRTVGLDLSMAEDSPTFDLLWERDSATAVRPDTSFLARPHPVPLVGLVLGHPQPEYGERGRHEEAHELMRRIVYGRRFSVAAFDTRVDPRSEEFRSPEEVETMVSRMDLVVTSRMHGMVHALKSGVPVVAVDPISGRAKIQRQAQLLNWPAILTADQLTEKALHRALDYCLTQQARTTAQACAEHARDLLQPTREEFVAALRSPSTTNEPKP